MVDTALRQEGGSIYKRAAQACAADTTKDLASTYRHTQEVVAHVSAVERMRASRQARAFCVRSHPARGTMQQASYSKGDQLASIDRELDLCCLGDRTQAEQRFVQGMEQQRSQRH